jgi:cyclic pyranopterin phosphate synthase
VLAVARIAGIMAAKRTGELIPLTVYDMCKAVDRSMSIGDIRLEEKLGGRSGHYRRVSGH